MKLSSVDSLPLLGIFLVFCPKRRVFVHFYKNNGGRFLRKTGFFQENPLQIIKFTLPEGPENRQNAEKQVWTNACWALPIGWRRQPQAKVSEAHRSAKPSRGLAPAPHQPYVTIVQ